MGGNVSIMVSLSRFLEGRKRGEGWEWVRDSTALFIPILRSGHFPLSSPSLGMVGFHMSRHSSDLDLDTKWRRGMMHNNDYYVYPSFLSFLFPWSW